MAIDAPIAWVRRRNAFRARRVGGAVEKGEIGGDEVRTRRHAHRQLSRKMICKIKNEIRWKIFLLYGQHPIFD